MRKTREFVTALIAAAISFTASAGDAPQSVGLVLSGGGAKGIAHIGVIKALEDNDIPIDYITGTSMGAIVGGLYALRIYAGGDAPAHRLTRVQLLVDRTGG